MSNQISRDEVMQEMKSKQTYPSEEMLNNDKEYFLKKMNWKTEDLENYINRKPKKHDTFKSEKILYYSLLKIFKISKFFLN